ncbi:cytochrome P450 71A1-like [Phalaenopsis equestris]|uniref:cytochrome P450 71A1-like n=1 Tax=Phalaenopsis equestris TaxID=78828 RepID=UPI0009E27A72|nr:cytochrome P450 71A1-like [Phalaenopsis equestris]
MNPLLLVSILLAPLFFLILVKRRSISNKDSRIPSPPGLPLIGNLHQLGPIPHLALHKLSKEHGPLMLLRFGTVRVLVVSSPKVIEELIRTNDLTFASRPLGKILNVLSYNQSDIGFSQYGESWRQMRRLGTTYLLSSHRVKSFISDRKEEVSLLLEKVAKEASRGNGVICMPEILSSFVTSVICRVVIGPSVSEEEKKRFFKLAHDTLTLISMFYVEDFFPKLGWLDVLRGVNERVKNHEKNWDNILEQIIKDHCNNSKEANGKNTTYLIDALFELQNNFSKGFALTRNHIKGLLLNLITAGSDTSSVTLDWCMAELIRNPEVMMKLKSEIKRVANGADMISEEQLGEMSYLQAFIKEVLRVHPPSPLLVPRESFQECQILGYKIPKNTRLLVNAWAFGRDELYWEAPEKFMPERFLNNSIDYIGKDFHYMPFGFGRRICPGMQFAKVMIELVLANLLLRFDWSLPRGITAEDLNMDDDGAIVAARKEKLELVPVATKFK